MKSKGIVLLFICFFALPTYGQRTDIIVLKNGDRITCEITGMDRGVLFAKVDYIDGLLEIDWRQVAKVESNRLFIVKTENGLVHEGKIRWLPGMLGGWTAARDMPEVPRQSFREWWKKREANGRQN